MEVDAVKIFVLNTGLGSQRCSLFDLPEGVLPDQPAGPQWEASSTRRRQINQRES
jgi:hypothetical protein